MSDPNPTVPNIELPPVPPGAPNPAPPANPAPRFPRLRKALEIAALIALGYLSNKIGIDLMPLAAGAEPARPTTVPFPTEDAPAARIAGATAYRPHQLVRLRAENTRPGAALVWRVSPRAGVERATTRPELLEFAAPPGSYDVELLAITRQGDGLSVEEVSVRVVVGAGQTPPAPKDKEDKADPARALCRIQFGNAGCTATVIGRRPDGRYDVLTAAHCVPGVGSRGTLTTQGGARYAVRAVVHEKTPDVCWLVTEEAVAADLAVARVAERNPDPGVKVWHAGFGVDRPGNREDGTVTVGQHSDGKTEFRLSVSKGDSGGGIFRADTGELVGTVCCTTDLSAPGRVWAGSAETCRRLRPGAVALDALPVPAPARPECRTWFDLVPGLSP